MHATPGAAAMVGPLAATHSDIDGMARGWLEGAEASYAIIDQDLTLHWAKGAAQIEFEGRDVFERNDDMLTTAEPADRAGLHLFLRETRSVRSTWSLPCAGGHMLVRGTQLIRTHIRRYIGIEFLATARFEPVYADLDRAFDLTAQEHRILKLLIASQSPGDVARHLGLRLPTIRTHIRNIYEKLDVTSREGLFRRVAPFRIV